MNYPTNDGFVKETISDDLFTTHSHLKFYNGLN